MTTEEKFTAYRKPRSETWLPLDKESYGTLNPDSGVSETEIDELVSRNKSELNEFLLGSLQLPNLSFFAGSGTSLGPVGGPSMWALWEKSVIDNPKHLDVLKKVNYTETENPNIEHFLSQCDAYLAFTEDDEVKWFVREVRQVILDQCSSFLDKPNSDIKAYEGLLQRLARRRVRDPRLKVFTTNYDMCFETASSNLGMTVVDGFSYSRKRRFDPKYFEYDMIHRKPDGHEYVEGVIQLYKLHGSVGWEREENDVYEVASPDPDRAVLIYPAKGKYQQAFIQPHLELLSRFLEFLRQPNACVIVAGFGFNDDHLSEPILSAIKSNPSFRLVVADFYAKKNIDNSGQMSSPYWQTLADLAKDGYNITFVNTDLSGLVAMIPNLRALTPADQLAKAVKQLGR